MRIFVTSAGAQEHHLLQRDHFKALAAADQVGAHQVAESAADADAVLFVDLAQHPGDALLRALRRHPLTRAYPQKVCVYDERDRPFASFPGIYVGGTPSLGRRTAVSGGPYPWLLTPIPRSNVAPDLLFSFSGARTHGVRDAVLGLTDDRARLRDTTGMNFFGWNVDQAGVADDDARADYTTTIQRSKFVLCPRGHGPSSFRLYETLAAGRVPVVISDHWLAPPRIDWEACLVRVGERDVVRVPQLLAEREADWPRMAAQAAATYDANFAPGRLWHHYASSICELLPAAPARPWWAQREVLRVTAGAVRSSLRRAPS